MTGEGLTEGIQEATEIIGGIDTPQDYARFVAEYAAGEEPAG